MMKVNILGTEYTVVIRDYCVEEIFETGEASGFCRNAEKEIVICDMITRPGWENETEAARDNHMKATLRHEIVHAFLSESGLSMNSNGTDAWARNEEMVDWFALQGPKIYKAWMKADAL